MFRVRKDCNWDTLPQAYRDSSYLSTDNAATESYLCLPSDTPFEMADTEADMAVQNEETATQVSEISLKVSI